MTTTLTDHLAKRILDRLGIADKSGIFEQPAQKKLELVGSGSYDVFAGCLRIFPEINGDSEPVASAIFAHIEDDSFLIVRGDESFVVVLKIYDDMCLFLRKVGDTFEKFSMFERLLFTAGFEEHSDKGSFWQVTEPSQELFDLLVQVVEE